MQDQNILIEQSCKYSNNAVKCIVYLTTTKLALNLTAIGTSNVNSILGGSLHITI